MAEASAAFGRLHPSVQRWIWQQGWTELRDAQEAAVELQDTRDGDRQAGRGQAWGDHADEFGAQPDEVRQSGRHEHGRQAAAQGDRPRPQPPHPRGSRREQRQRDHDQDDERFDEGPPDRSKLDNDKIATGGPSCQRLD